MIYQQMNHQLIGFYIDNCCPFTYISTNVMWMNWYFVNSILTKDLVTYKEL